MSFGLSAKIVRFAYPPSQLRIDFSARGELHIKMPATLRYLLRLRNSRAVDRLGGFYRQDQMLPAWMHADKGGPTRQMDRGLLDFFPKRSDFSYRGQQVG